MKNAAMTLIPFLIIWALVVGYIAGTVVEEKTHALHVSRITGAPYLQILAPLARLETLIKGAN